KGTQTNSAVVYGDRFLLKLFRRLEEGRHPEIEVGRHLAATTDFHHAAPLVGALEYRPSSGEAVTLAALEGWVPNQGDAWHLTQETLGRFYEWALVSPGPRPEPPVQPLLVLMNREVPA